MFALESAVELCGFATGHDRIKQQWPAISGQLQHRWRKLTADDVLFADGSADYLARVVQDRYGIDRREARCRCTSSRAGCSVPVRGRSHGVATSARRPLSSEMQLRFRRLQG